MTLIDQRILTRIDDACNRAHRQIDSGVHEAFTRCLYCKRVLTGKWKHHARAYCDKKCMQSAKNERRKSEI